MQLQEVKAHKAKPLFCEARAQELQDKGETKTAVKHAANEAAKAGNLEAEEDLGKGVELSLVESITRATWVSVLSACRTGSSLWQVEHQSTSPLKYSRQREHGAQPAVTWGSQNSFLMGRSRHQESRFPLEIEDWGRVLSEHLVLCKSGSYKPDGEIRFLSTDDTIHPGTEPCEARRPPRVSKHPQMHTEANLTLPTSLSFLLHIISTSPSYKNEALSIVDCFEVWSVVSLDPSCHKRCISGIYCILRRYCTESRTRLN